MKLNEYGMTRGKPTPVGDQGNTSSNEFKKGNTSSNEFKKGNTVLDKDGNTVGKVVSAAGEQPEPDVVIIKNTDDELAVLDDKEEYQLQAEEAEKPKVRKNAKGLAKMTAVHADRKKLSKKGYMKHKNQVEEAYKRFYTRTQGVLIKASYRIERIIKDLEDSIVKWGEINVPENVKQRYFQALNNLIALSKEHGIDESKRVRKLINKLNGKQNSSPKNILGKYSHKLNELTQIVDLPLEKQIEKLSHVTEEDIRNASAMILTEKQEHESGTYATFIINDASKKLITDWCKDNNISCNDDLHCTIIYSRKPVPSLTKYHDKKINITAKIKSWDLFGENKDHLVLKIKHPDIIKINKTMMNAGATSDYKIYEPHVTINSAYFDDIPDSLPNFDIELNKMEIRPLVEGAVPDNNSVHSLVKLMNEKMAANDIKKQMNAYFAIPDPSMLADFRRIRAMEGDFADLRPTLESYIRSQLHPELKSQIMKEGYKDLPPVNKTSHGIYPGLKGPIVLRTGKIIYYDPDEDKFYDPDINMHVTDQYLQKLHLDDIDALRSNLEVNETASVGGMGAGAIASVAAPNGKIRRRKKKK